ncbi:MAG: PAS domain S-box protein, partial [Proteobacteria bacterium]
MKKGSTDQNVAVSEARKDLKKSEDRYHSMIDEVEDYAIILLDLNGEIQDWNRGAEKIKGYKAAEAIGKHFSMFYLPEDRQSGLPFQLLDTARKEGKAVHEGWRVRKDGTKFWGSITLTALHGEQNEIIGYSKVTRDLTDKKLAEDQLRKFARELQLSNEALRKSEERYHKMIAEVQDYAIILLDSEGKIQNWNVGAEKIKGYTAREIIGKNFQIFYSEDDRLQGLPLRLLSEARENGRAVHEGWRVTKSGSRFWGSIVITALHDDEGHVMGYSKVTRDLTAKKETEDKVREYLHELEEQNEELDRFAYAASHDLQEPLRKIQTFADLIETRPSDPERVMHYIKKVNVSSERMQSLIKSLLAYTKLSKGADKKITTDFNHIFEGVLGDYELLIEEKHARITCDLLPTLEAIPQQLTQLFSNLISNALKFSALEPVITVSSDKVQS